MEILDWLDDHARYALSVTAHRRVTGPIVLETFRKAFATHGVPASTLTDNGMVFTTRLSGGKGGRNGFENEPWKTVEDVEVATLGWVHWHNTSRLHGYLNDIPPQSSKPSSTL